MYRYGSTDTSTCSLTIMLVIAFIASLIMQNPKVHGYLDGAGHFDRNSRTAAVGSVSRIPAADVEDVVIKSLNEHSTAGKMARSSDPTSGENLRAILENVIRIDVHKDRLSLRLVSPGNSGADDSTSERTLSIARTWFALSHEVAAGWTK